MADHDGHTINVGPVTVGEIVTGGEGSDVGESATATESRTAPTPFGDSARWGAVDPDRTRAWLADNWPKGNHLTIVLHDYCDEVDRLRAVVRAADEVWRCHRCGGGGLIAPGDWCQTCAGDGLRVEWADDGSDLRPLVEALAALAGVQP